jgi:hypothetical protein
MEKRIVEAVNEMEETGYTTLEQIKADYSLETILDLWLRYEGVIGYTDTIIGVIQALRITPDRGDNWSIWD